MINIQRHFLRKYSRDEVDSLVVEAAARIRTLVPGVVEITVFGSALTDHFDDVADLDLVLIFGDEVAAHAAEKLLYRNAHTFSRPIDFLCVDRKTFKEKSDVGGVFWIAAKEGRVVYRSETQPGN